MLVRVTKGRVPYIGRRGDQRELSTRHANLLIRLGAVEKVEAEVEEMPIDGGYLRRDMRANDGRKAPRKRRAKA